MECEQRSQQIVLPVFYDVDPSDVRNQKGSLEKAFAMHEERFREGQVARWRAALTKAASLSGWDLHNVAHRFESELIDKIIGDISNKLNLEYFMVASYPVGLETRMQNLSKLLNRDSSNVHMVGIWGIGGIGKTTIAKAIYNQLQRKFEGSCFLEDVREIAKKPNGLIDLQELILSSVHVNDNRKIKHVDQGTMVIKKSAWCKRVLVVLDDVDHRDQLEKLAIRRGYFQPGSIIIITTRDKSMLKLDEVDKIYMPQELDHNESIKLLSWHAFGKDHPNENYAELSKEVMCYARGLPLALKVLGSFLSDKSTNEWEGTLEKLKVIPHDEIQEKLLVSFWSLSDTQKELFLDIACFFVGMEKNYACKILQDSNLVLDSELGVLVRRSLVKIDCSNRLRMHDMIRDMGREVVRRQSTRVLGERSRLWFHEDVLDVLQNHMGTEVVEGIMLNLPGVYDLQVDSKAFARMHQLRVLQLNYACLKGNFQCPSKRLRYLEWYGFLLKTIPSDLHMENLVAIYMPYSSLIELWTGTKILQKLKFLDVSHSYHLVRTPDFSGITNLEVLVLNNCTSLVEVHNSVVHLNKLVNLDLADCKNLTKIPSGIYKLKSDYVNLSGCTKLDMVPRFEFTSPSTLSYSLHISSKIPLESFGFKISKLLQLKGLTDCASLVENHEAITNTFLMNKAITNTYDVFVSFYGKDTRLSFTDYPFAALYWDGILCFRDDRKLRRGKDILTKLEKAIETSRIAIIAFSTKYAAIIVFSTNYAALRWGLDERSQQIVLPDFYDVDPSDVQNPKGSLEKAFAMYEKRFREGEVARRRAVLTKAACLSGWYLLKNLTKIPPEIYKLKFDNVNNIGPFRLPVVIFNFLNHLTILNVSLSRRFCSLDELPKCLQAMGANNATSLEWILTGSNLKLSEQLIISIGCSKLLKKNHTCNPKKKLLKESIARDSFSVFLPGAEFPDWLNYNSTGSILSFIVPPLVKQKIRGWFLCAVFASRFHDIYGFTVICKFKNNTKGTELLYRQKNCLVIPCQEHLWLHSVPLHHVPHLLEAGDEVEYSIHISGSFQPKKFGVNVIYENDKKDYQSYFEAMIQNASFPYKNVFLDEDVSTAQAMASDNKVHPSNVQMSRFGDKRKGIATFSDASKCRCLSAREAARHWWDEELAARFQDKEDVTTSRHCELNTSFLEGPTKVPEDEMHGIFDFEIMEDEAVNENSTVASTPSQDFTISDRIIATTTSHIQRKRRCLESAAARHPSHRHPPLKDHTALAVEPSEGNGQRGWPYFHETPQEAMFFEGRAPFEQNLYSSGIPTMYSMSQTERLRSLESEGMLTLWEARHQLENERRAHLATRENAAWASWQHRDQIAALKSKNICLRMALEHARQFSPQLYMDLPRPHFESESASSSQFATASSSLALTQSTIAGLTPMASTRRGTLDLDYDAFLDSPVQSIQSFNDPSRSTPPNQGSDLSQ